MSTKAQRDRWLQDAHTALRLHGGITGVCPEHYNNIVTWMASPDRPSSEEMLALLQADPTLGHDQNGTYFWELK